MRNTFILKPRNLYVESLIILLLIFDGVCTNEAGFNIIN